MAQTKQTTRKPASRSSTQQDGIALLKADHKTVEELFKRYERAGDRAIKTKETVRDRVVRELSIHAAIEEQVLYPSIRDIVPGGDKMVEEGIEEHQEAKEVLLRLSKMEPEDEGFDAAMRELIGDVRHHVKEEETEIFPKLREHASKDQLRKMGELMRLAKKLAPTRPHPQAPNTPPGNLAVGLVAGILDRVRDAGRKAMDR